MCAKYTREESIARFWSRVEKSDSPDDCWLWTGAADSRGYGNLQINNAKFSSHRLAYELTYGSAGSLLVLHRCDNPRCCNPNHLFLGTHQDNMTDMKTKKRAASGERNSKAKLTQNQVLYIRENYLNGNTTQRALAREMKVSQRVIWQIVNNKTWTIPK